MNDSSQQTNSERYQEKKRFFNQVITLYGRKPVLEILQDDSLAIYRLHLSESNKPQGIINDITTLAKQRNIDIHYHDKQALSRLSKNSKQDQGVCIDILCPQHQPFEDFLAEYQAANTIDKPKKTIRLIALDRITNPQNMGMIIRSICAGNVDGLLIPEKGCARIDSLVVKASAGTLFKSPLLHCKQLAKALTLAQEQGAKVYGLSSHADKSIKDTDEDAFIIYVLGNETDGMSQEIGKICDNTIYIPMNNHVESLNVAVTASLLAFKGII